MYIYVLGQAGDAGSFGLDGIPGIVGRPGDDGRNVCISITINVHSYFSLNLLNLEVQPAHN
jgi:hypothetical protein